MHKVFFAAILIILSNTIICGQNFTGKNAVCSDKDVEKVSSRGIKIGAKIDDVLNIFASNDEEKRQIRNSTGQREQKLGFGSFIISPKRDDKRFEGISSYSFGFLDGKLVSLYVNYTKPHWKDTNQFTETIVKFFDLPDVKYWNSQQGVGNNIQCGDYKIDLSAASGGTLQVYNLRTKGILEQREQKLIEETREKDIKGFKPE